MFQDLDATLKALLADSGAPAEVRSAEVSFTSPDKDFRPDQATVNLFLHEVAENRDLRDDTPVREHTAGGGFLFREAPMRLDCTYLVTTWSTKEGGLRAEEEHRLLGLALLWLRSFPVVAERFLQGELRMPPSLFPVTTEVARVKEGQRLGDFWTALGVAPRPAFFFTATVGLRLPTQPVEQPAVSGLRLAPTSLSRPALTGLVLGTGLVPVPDVPVALVAPDRETLTDRHGGFAFDGLDFGTYTLLARPAGRPEVRREVRYAADSQVHDLILPEP
ncbi:Pvc16 family protein [Streptomyces sp. NPDC090025]|uniref:Pvc16 family protein n=1 Tax=Streptomyces sp. NPDC090025 TaxID=3365922 RepID=UPI003837F5C2